MIKAGVKIQYNSGVNTVSKKADGKLELTTSNGSQIFDCVISTLSSKASVQIAGELTEAEKQQTQ